MKEHLFTLTQRNDKQLKAPFAAIMGLESDTQLKLSEEGGEMPASRLSTGIVSDPEESSAVSRAHRWLIGVALVCMLLSYWVISRWF